MREYIYGCVFFLALALVYYTFTPVVESVSIKDTNPIFGILCTFKNEEMVIREWVEHYLWQGADYIILLNNGSTDNFKAQLTGFDDRVVVIDAPEQHAQVKNYNEIGLPEVKRRNISMLAIIDVDEFMFAKDGTNLKTALVDIFSQNPEVSQLYVNWIMFGSSGHDTQPSSIRSSFTKCSKDIHELGKSILLTKNLNKIDVHESDITGSKLNVSDTIQLNHYAIQSKEYFEKVKMTRGDAYYSSVKYNTIRDWNYFNAYDHKDVDDFLLRDYVKKYV